MMRWVLVLMLAVVSAGQFIKHNTWKVQAKKIKDHEESSNLLLRFRRKKGKVMFFAAQSSLTLSLVDQTAFQSEYLTGLMHRLDINIDFGQQIPFHYGRIDGQYTVTLHQKGERKQYIGKITYWPNKKIIIVLQKTTIQATLYPYSLAYLILLNICLAGVMILLLTVLLRRKRWSQTNPHFLIILLGWKIKKIMILWFQCRVFDAAEGSYPGTVITKGLLVILTIKSVKIVAQVIRITLNITKSRSTTFALITLIVTFILFLPMKYLHILIPITFSLQFQKYNRYSRLDFQVHYTLLLLNLFISIQSIYRIINYNQHLSTYDIILLVYSIVGMLVWTIMGELYQYGENNNRSSPCLLADFDNKRFCPSCEEQLYDELQTEANRLKSRERHDLIYDLWKFGVADCGHIFHRHCLLQLLKTLKSCQLIDHPSTPTPTIQPKSLTTH